MSDNGNYGFARLVPGFDFLQNLAKGASQGMNQMPSLSSWVAPTLNVEELDKRITELKAVQFWLEQNGKALAATIQALEVQKMTLATLHGMNFSMGELANALTLKTSETMGSGVRRMGEAAEAAASAAAEQKKDREKQDKDKQDKEKPAGKKAEGAAAGAGNGASPVDPLQWWGSLTQQFQQIAANAMKEVAQQAGAQSARTGAANESSKPAKASARRSKDAASSDAPAQGKKGSAGKASARRTRAKKTAA